MARQTTLANRVQRVDGKSRATRKLRERVSRITRRLERVYGRPTLDGRLPLDNKSDPVDELVFIILSIQTSERGFNTAFAELKRRYPSWDKLLTARIRGIQTVLRPFGLSNQKAHNLRALLQSVKQARGDLTLNFIAGLPVREGEAYLTALPGVGIKTARCVLMYCFGAPVFPVDTHVLRVSKRLGLVPKDLRRKAAHSVLEGLVPPSSRYSLHVNMVKLGRDYCTVASPRCLDCPLRRTCPSYPDGGGIGTTP